MGVIIALAIVLLSVMVIFLDKIIEWYYPTSTISTSEKEIDAVLNEVDCTRAHTTIE